MGGHGAAAHEVRGLATAAGGLRVVVEDAGAAARPHGDARLPDRRRARRDRARLRRRAHQAHAPDPRPPRPHGLPAPAPRAARRRHLGDRACGSPTPARTGCSPTSAAAARPQTLASDLRVDGAADLRPLPDAAPAAVCDGGYDVRLDAGDAHPGAEAELRFTITKDGEPVATEPYLGAGGHLVALREGDLAFLHVHPTDEAGSSEIGFAATFPTDGPLPPVPPVPARRRGPDRRLHAGGAVMAGGAPRAADHRHDLRVVREPDRAQAQHARRRDRDGQLRHRAGDGRLRRRRGRARAAGRGGRGGGLQPRCRCPTADAGQPERRDRGAARAACSSRPRSRCPCWRCR